MQKTRSGLVFRLKKKKFHSLLPQTLNLDATIYFTAVLEHLTAEILEHSGDVARKERKTVIDETCVVRALENDKELRQIAGYLTKEIRSNKDFFIEQDNLSVLPRTKGSRISVEPLIAAVSSKKYDIAKQILENTGDIDQIDFNGNTLLHCESEVGSLQGIQFLVENHANVNIVNQKNQAPLHVAALNSHSEACLKLLSSGADINCRDCYGRTPLHLSLTIRNGLSLAELLTKQGASLDASDRRGDTILHYLFTYADCNQPQFQYLLEVILSKYPEMINQKNDEGFTPFQILVESRGCKPNIQREKLLELISELVGAKQAKLNGLSANEKFPYTSPLCIAINTEDIAVMKILLNAQSDILERDSDGRTALHLACEESNEETIKLLCEHGGTKFINQVDDDGVPPYLLVAHQDEDKVLSLIDYFTKTWHVDWMKRDEFGRNIAHNILLNVPAKISCLILSRFDKQALEVLLTEPDSNFGMTSLHFIATCEHNNSSYDDEEPPLLLDSELFDGLDKEKLVNQRDSLGRTPFLLSVANSYQASDCRILLDWGADVDIPDNNGETPIFFAWQDNTYHADYVAPFKLWMLLNNRADFNQCNKEGRSFWLDFVQNIPVHIQDDIEGESIIEELKNMVDRDQAFKKFRQALKKKTIRTLEATDDLVDCSPYAWKRPLDWPQDLQNIYVESKGHPMKNDRNYKVYASLQSCAEEDTEHLRSDEEEKFSEWKRGLYGKKRYNGYQDLFEFIHSTGKPQEESSFSKSDAYEPDNFHRTPLHDLVMMDEDAFFEIKEEFLSSDAPFDIQDDCGRTPVHEAVHAGEHYIINDPASFTVRDFDGRTILHEAALDIPIPPNTIDKNGRTPLHSAVLRSVWNPSTYSKKNSFYDLPPTDGIIDERDKFGKTALMYAATTNLTELISALLEKGAQVNLQDFEGRTALHEVCTETTTIQTEKDEPFELLLNAGGNPWITDLNGNTALDVSIGQINAKHINRAVLKFPHPHNLQNGLILADFFHDLVFKTTEGSLVYAHQIILQIRAGDFWSNLLQNGFSEPIQIAWSEWSFKKFLEYCYTDTITVDFKEASIQASLLDLRNLALKLSIPRLAAICGYLITTHNSMPFDEYLPATNPSRFNSDLRKVMDIIPTMNQGLVHLLAEDGKSVTIPKLFLMCRSDYFSKMFQSGMVESISSEIKVPMPAKIVELMKEYFIMGTLNNLAQYDAETLGALLDISSVYQLDFLQNQLELLLCKQLDKTNIETLVTLTQYNLPLLASMIQQFRKIEEIQSETRKSKKRMQDSTRKVSKKQKKEFSTDPNIFAIHPLPMTRMIREIAQDYKTDLFISPAAFYEMHKAAEDFLVEVFEKALEEAKKKSRNEVVSADFQKVCK